LRSPIRRSPSRFPALASLYFPNIAQSQIDVLQHFLPDEFFEERIDPIELTLERLPEVNDPLFLSVLGSLAVDSTKALRTVSRPLNHGLLDNSRDILVALDRISSLNSQFNVSTTGIRATPDVLLRSEKEVCDHPRTFFGQIVKRKNLGTVFEWLQTVDAISKRSDELNRTLKKRDFKVSLRSVEINQNVSLLFDGFLELSI
jgi:hypothetical protein